MDEIKLTPEEIKCLQELGRQIREIRNSKALTQYKLGEIAGMSGNYIGEIERGKRNIYYMTLVRIAEAFNCDVAAFTKGIPVNKKTDCKS
ncbi:MAG: helix-turn-helix domain-containing protein [Tannerellaceae bacterium]|nr:helix-turn-helix domain-containing protein [Tannerellaceae bacterium]